MINSLDLETYGSEYIIPYCICTYYNRRCFVFYGLNCVDKWCEWVFNYCKNDTIFYIHNLNFDGNVILTHLPRFYNISYKGTVLKKGDLFCLVLTNNLKNIKLLCSFKIFPMSLEEIGYLFNIGSKKYMDHSIANVETIKDVSFKQSVIKYCSNDALLVINFLEKIKSSVSELEKIYNMYSISGLSINIFKKNFNFIDINLNMFEEFDKIIRPAYYGGRCEVFGNLKNDETCYHFDFSGMYTNRLMEEYPYGAYKIIKNIKNIKKFGFYYVSVYSDLELPILPYRDPKSGKLLFPNGNFSGLYWGEELMLFEENGGIIKTILYGIEFDKSDYIFKKFGIFCDEKRKNSKWEKVLWKIIPNSFIGRMGLKYDDEETLILEDNKYDPRAYNVICDKKINNMWVVRIKKENNRLKNNNVAYPAIITSKARILWWKSAIEVKKNFGRILYCDTDSIFAAFPKKHEVLGKRHGDVYWDPSKLDTKLDDACFVTSKVYCITYDQKNIFKIKGVSKKYIKELDMESFKELFLKSKTNFFKTTIFERKKMNLKIIELNKIIDFSSYDKRIFNKEKTETKSIVV